MKVFHISAVEMPEDFSLVVGVIRTDDFRNGEVELEKPIDDVEITSEALVALGVSLIQGE